MGETRTTCQRGNKILRGEKLFLELPGNIEDTTSRVLPIMG